MRTWPAIVLMAGCCLIGAVVGGAAASSLSLDSRPVETGSVAVTAACGTPPLTIAAPRSLFAAPGDYRVRQVPVSAVVANCQAKPYLLTIADDNAPFTSLASWNGTLPTAQTGNLTDVAGADVNAVPATNQIRVYLVASSS